MYLKTFKRYEKKYIISYESYLKLSEQIKKYMNPDPYCENGKKYTVYNIYYDDADMNVIRHSISKPFFKEKLRIRGYKPFDNENDTVFAELKRKVGGVVFKRRCVMPLKAAKRLVKNRQKPECSGYIDSQVADEILFYLKKHPAKFETEIIYDRFAFFGKDNGDFRLTFDFNIRAVENGRTIFLGECDSYIMEIKICNEIPLWLSRAISELDIKRIRFSKYGEFYKYKRMHMNRADGEMHSGQ